MPPTREPIASDNLLTVTIHLEQDDRGRTHITYRPSVLQALRTDSVKWRCDAGPFDIEFKGLTPVGHVHISSHSNHETESFAISEHVRPGHYSYAVVLRVGDRCYIDAGCPQIIIED